MSDTATATETRHGVYEVMFLISQSEAVEFASLIEHIENLIARAGAELLAIEKWDEKRLAYPIEKQRRAVFILTYIKCPKSGIQQLERDVNISERIMRMLVIKADHISPEEIASHDNRDALGAEAKLRAERAVEDARREAQRVEVLTAEEAAEARAREAEMANAADDDDSEMGDEHDEDGDDRDDR